MDTFILNVISAVNTEFLFRYEKINLVDTITKICFPFFVQRLIVSKAVNIHEFYETCEINLTIHWNAGIACINFSHISEHLSREEEACQTAQ